MKKNSTRFKINGVQISKGERKKIQLEIASLFDYTTLSIPIEVIRGKEDGPVLFISAAIHGDEINGVEIIKRIRKKSVMNRMKGTLILVPVVNVFGFINKTRYLPDRRDLNRCFPGTSDGSLGSRLAKLFMSEIVSKCTHGIDLHTGAIHRSNLPQIRACLDDPETEKLAKYFGVPVVIDSKLRDGSLREAARKKKVKTLLFEGGEALRFEEGVIKSGVKGCLSVMREIGMIPKMTRAKVRESSKSVFISQGTYWVRAPHSGSFRLLKKMGSQVETGDPLALISDPFGDNIHTVYAKDAGIIIGMMSIPLVSQGDAMVHIATFRNKSKVKSEIDRHNELLG